MKNSKLIPAIVMLLGGAVCTIMSFVNHYDLKKTTSTLLTVLLIFLVIGWVIRFNIEKYIPYIEEEEEEEDGSVIEKESEESEDGESVEETGEGVSEKKAEETEDVK